MWSNTMQVLWILWLNIVSCESYETILLKQTSRAGGKHQDRKKTRSIFNSPNIWEMKNAIVKKVALVWVIYLLVFVEGKTCWREDCPAFVVHWMEGCPVCMNGLLTLILGLSRREFSVHKGGFVITWFFLTHTLLLTVWWTSSYGGNLPLSLLKTVTRLQLID